MKKILGLLLTIIFTAAFGIYFYNNQSDFKALGEVPFYSLILIGLFKLCDILSGGIFMQIMLRAFGKDITLYEGFYISLLSKIGNYFAPLQGGAGIRAVYLKSKFQLSYSHFISTLSGNYIIAFLVNSIIGLSSLAYIHFAEGQYSIILYIFYVVLFSVTFTLSIFPFPERLHKLHFKSPTLNRFIRIFKDITGGWNEIIRNRALLLKLILITFFNFGLLLAMGFVEFKTLGIEFNLATLALYSSLSGVSILVNLTPGAIGIREAVFIFSSAMLALSETEILQIAVIDRGVLFVLLAVLYIIVKIVSNIPKLNAK